MKTVQHGRTTFSLAPGTGEWKGYWIITNERTKRPHKILKTEREANESMKRIQADADAAESQQAQID